MTERLAVPFIYRVAIKQVKTGEIRVREEVWEFTGSESPEQSVEYFWTDGNFGCDCNRAIWFRNDGTIDGECGQGAYRVRLSSASGNVFYSEFADAQVS